MNILLLFFIACISWLTPAIAAETNSNDCAPLLNFQVRTLNDSQTIHLCEAYKNKVILVVNTASKCGYTPQYEGLEKLYGILKEKDFVVLGFPSNDFGGQEPGSEAKVQQFCRLTYGVEFPMFEKTSVKEGNASPFYSALIASAGVAPQWNFHKYLIGKNGQVIGSFSSQVRPNDPALVNAIHDALSKE